MKINRNSEKVNKFMEKKKKEGSVKVKDTSVELLDVILRLLTERGVEELKTTSLDLVWEHKKPCSRDTIVRRLKDLSKLHLIELRTERGVRPTEAATLYIKLKADPENKSAEGK